MEECVARGEEEGRDSRRAREALGSFRRALALAGAQARAEILARAWLGRARAHLKLGELEEGLRAAREAVVAARLAGDRGREAWALDEMGNAYYFQSDYENALHHFQMALGTIEGRNLPSLAEACDEANYSKDIGIAYTSLGQLDRALFYLARAARLYAERNERSPTVSVLGNLGSLYSRLGAGRLALSTFEQALHVAQENRKPREILDILTRIGSLYLSHGFPEKALKRLEPALSLAEGAGMPLEQAWVLDFIAIAQTETGAREAAVASRERVLGLWRRMKNGPHERFQLCELGNLWLESDPEAAAGYFLEALKVPERLGLRHTWMAHAGLARAARKRGDLTGAIEGFEESVRRIESFRGKLPSEEDRTNVLAWNQRTYQDLIEVLLERHARSAGSGDDARAFQVSERARAQALLEALSEARTDLAPAPDPELARRDRELQTRVAGLRTRLSALDEAAPERRGVVEEITRMELESDQLFVEIRRRRGERAAPLPRAPVTLEETQALLDDSQALLAFVLTETKAFAFLVTANALHVETLPASPEELSERVRVLVDLMVQAPSTGFPGLARRLYSDLIEPVRNHFPPGIRELVIVPDGALHSLPFETLMSAIGPDRYLLEDFAVSYAPSATVLAELKRGAGRAAPEDQAELIVFGDPEFLAGPVSAGAPASREPGPATAGLVRALYEDEGLPITPLFHAASEARVIARYAGPASKILTGSEASEARLKSLRLDGYQVLHFATHGLISQRSPSRSALVLASGGEAEDGFLQAREISRLKLASDLVVLSACQTARGRIVAGEGVQGIARAFFSAGARTVVGSLWNVNDRSTARLMAAFYRRLARGESKAQALRSAKLELLLRKDSSSPRHWAPFVLIGEPRETVPIAARDAGWLPAGQWLSAILFLVFLAPMSFLLVRRLSERRPEARGRKRAGRPRTPDTRLPPG